MEQLTHWKKEANKDYLGSWSLIAGADANDKPIYREVIATITKVEKQAIPDMEAIKKGKNNATKDELLDYALRTGAPMEIIENLQEIEDDEEIYESIEDLWPDYPTKDDFFFDEEEY